MADSNYLSNIENIVVLMMENRSFDNVLGYLYDPENEESRFKKPPAGQTFDGVIEFPGGKLKDGLTNPYPEPNRGSVQFGSSSVMTDPNPDAGELYQDIFAQFFYGQTLEGIGPVPANPPQTYPPMLETPGVPVPNTSVTPAMQGFVANYQAMLDFYNLKHPKHPAEVDPSVVMAGYRPASLPILNGLANAYCVCDNWFSSIPTQTFCNRSFIHAGTSSGYVNNIVGEHEWDIFENDTETIYDVLEAGGVEWGIFYSGYLMLCNAYLTQKQVRKFHHGIDRKKNRLWHLTKFRELAQAGNLPSYSFLEPNFVNSELFGPENDMHPPYVTPWQRELGFSNLLNGEKLIYDVYRWVFGDDGSRGENTLLIVTFDEHGGLYDHVAPPGTVAPDGSTQVNGFDFKRLGARVGTLLISPRIPQGRVCHTQFDHSSVPRTVLDRFAATTKSQAPLGARVANANRIPGQLLAGAAVPDRPPIGPPRAVTAANAPSDSQLSDVQRAMLLAAGRLEGLSESSLAELGQVQDAGNAEHYLSEFEKRAGGT